MYIIVDLFSFLNKIVNDDECILFLKDNSEIPNEFRFIMIEVSPMLWDDPKYISDIILYNLLQNDKFRIYKKILWGNNVINIPYYVVLADLNLLDDDNIVYIGEGSVAINQVDPCDMPYEWANLAYALDYKDTSDKLGYAIDYGYQNLTMSKGKRYKLKVLEKECGN